MMDERERYIANWGDDSLTIMRCICKNPQESVVPLDGSVMLRNDSGKIVGKRIENISNEKWTWNRIGDSFAIAFGRGGAGPLWAAFDSCRSSLMAEKYKDQYGETPPQN